MTRTGQIHSVEAILAAVLLLTFVTTVLPDIGGGDAESPSIADEARPVLASLDASGMLGAAVADRDADRIRDRVSAEIADRQVAVRLRTTNLTTFTGTTTGRTADLRARETTSAAVLHVWLRDAHDPRIRVNDTYVQNHTGRVQDRYHRLAIGDHLSAGTTTLNVTVSQASEIGYTAAVTDEQLTTDPPGRTDIYATSYTMAAVNDTVQPTEVTLLTWR